MIIILVIIIKKTKENIEMEIEESRQLLFDKIADYKMIHEQKRKVATNIVKEKKVVMSCFHSSFQFSVPVICILNSFVHDPY